MVSKAYNDEATGALMRFSARVMEAKEFWLSYEIGKGHEANLAQVIQGRWFGNISENYIARLLSQFEQRFWMERPFAPVLQAYFQNSIDHAEFCWFNHLSLLAYDPYYRNASSQYIPNRLDMGLLDISRDAFYKWQMEQMPKETTVSTATKYGRHCLGALMENGLLKGDAKKSITSPAITARTLALLLYTLAELGEGAMSFDGSPLFLSLLKTREMLVPTMMDGERLGYWDFTGDRTRLSLNLKYPSLKSWVEALL